MFLIEDIVSFFNQFPRDRCVVQDKNLVLFLGLTGSGKSTTINYLLGCRFEWDDDGVAQSADHLPAFVGRGAESGTSYPATYDLSGDGLLSLCDCPGLADTRSLETQVGISLCMDTVVHQPDTNVRAVVIVIDWSSLLDRRAGPFRQLIAAVGDIISDIEPIKSSLFFVFNRVTTHVTQASIVKKLSTILEAEQHDLTRYLQSDDKESIKRTQHTTRVLSFMLVHQDKLSVVDVCDDGKSRKKILTYLESATNVPSRYLNFNTAEESRRHFDHLLLDQLTHFSNETNQLTPINGSIAALETQITAVRQKTTEYQGWQHQSRPQKNETALLPIRERIVTLSKELQQAREKVARWTKTESEERRQLMALDSATPTSYRTLEPYKHKMNFLRGNDSYYYFKGRPFVRVAFDGGLSGGQIEIIDNAPSSGLYEAKYRRFSSTYDAYNPTATIYVESRLHPENIVKIEKQKNEIATTQRIILHSNTDIQRIERLLLVENTSLNSEQKKLDDDYLKKMIYYETGLQCSKQLQAEIPQQVSHIKTQYHRFISTLDHLGSSMQTRTTLLLPLIDIIQSCTFRDASIKRLFNYLCQARPLAQVQALKIKLEQLHTVVNQLPAVQQHNAENRHVFYQPSALQAQGNEKGFSYQSSKKTV